jgi:hypothetical protein
MAFRVRCIQPGSANSPTRLFYDNRNSRRSPLLRSVRLLHDERERRRLIKIGGA